MTEIKLRINNSETSKLLRIQYDHYHERKREYLRTSADRAESHNFGSLVAYRYFP